MNKLEVAKNVYVDKIYIINLEYQKKLKENITKHLTKLDIINYVEFIKAENRPNDPTIGCLISHKNAIRNAAQHNYDTVMVLEDDCFFVEFPFKYKAPLPEDWKMLYPGYMTYETRSYKYNESFLKLIDARAIHCYIIKKDIYNDVLNIKENSKLGIDMWYIRVIQRVYPTYGFYPIKAYQSVHPSTLTAKGVVKDWRPIMDSRAKICYGQNKEAPPRSQRGKPQPKSNPKPQSKSHVKPTPKPQSKSQINSQSKSQIKIQSK